MLVQSNSSNLTSDNKILCDESPNPDQNLQGRWENGWDWGCDCFCETPKERLQWNFLRPCQLQLTSPTEGLQLQASPQWQRQVRQQKSREVNSLRNLRPQLQSNSISCGQTAVAMTLTHLTGKAWDDRSVQSRYGFGLWQALSEETAHLGLVWKDRDFSKSLWPTLEQKLKLGRPVIMGLNGPDFSPSGRGHIVALVGIRGDQVTFCDPASGKRRTLAKSAFEGAAPHPDGKFVFYASKERPSSNL